MLSHGRIWAAIDRLAERQQLTVSGLARRAGLDPTTFNRSKRQAADGRPRWPSTESIAKILDATGTEMAVFLDLVEMRPASDFAALRHVPILGLAQAGAGGFFDDGGFPAGQGWDAIDFPGPLGDDVFALEVTGDSMLPLYRHGDTIIVARGAAVPARRPGGGQDLRRRGHGQGSGAQDRRKRSSLSRSIRTHPEPILRRHRNRVDGADHLGEPVRALALAVLAIGLTAATAWGAGPELVEPAVRNVTPPGMTPGPEVDGPLIREPVPPPPPDPAALAPLFPARHH